MTLTATVDDVMIVYHKGKVLAENDDVLTTVDVEMEKPCVLAISGI